MEENKRVEIILATHEGANYIAAQIDSILNQSYKNWTLRIGDDHSTDNTWEIISDYQKRFPEKITAVRVSKGGSAQASFFELLRQTTAPLIMFCDQDDVWLPDKILVSMATLKENGALDVAALVYTDMEVVSESLATINSSFLKMQGLNPAWSQHKAKAVVQSMAAGCTMLFTRQLVDVLREPDHSLFLHDHWLLMHAAIFGRVCFCDERTMYYRQHQKNAVGSSRLSATYFTSKVTHWKKSTARFTYARKKLALPYTHLYLWIVKIALNLMRILNTRFKG